jgi:hypothetical protein
MEITWPAIPGRSYAIDFTNDLTQAWQPLPGSPFVTAPTAFQRTVADAPAPEIHQRFYRLRLLP